ncbi:CsbD family protein [candidate division KSB1 bacterium]|nr:CsbD family protein [candidate division KSB1 bacterium]
MNWDQIKSQWLQAKGEIKAKWGKLSDDDLKMIEGQRDKLVGKIQEKYGIAKEEAEKQVNEFQSKM